jgi:hypothetical protein
MNSYIFHKVSDNKIRALMFVSDDAGYKSVAHILDMSFDGSKESMKHTIKCLYEMLFVGEQSEDSEGYEIRTDIAEYDVSLEGKARKQSSKEINVLTEQLWAL